RYRPEAGDFIAVARMAVSEDGTRVCTDEGAGIVRTGWHSVSAVSLGEPQRSRKATPKLGGKVQVPVQIPGQIEIPQVEIPAAPAQARSVIVVFEDEEVQRQANAMRAARGARFEAPDIRTMKVDAFAALRDQFRRNLSARGIRIVTEFKHLPMAYVEIAGDPDIAVLESQPGVIGVFEEMTFHLHVAQTLPLIGQPNAVAAGFQGAGAAIAILDTGVDFVAEFGNCPGPNCRLVSRQDFSLPDGDPGDDDGHGTNVAAIAASVAPGADIIGIDVFDQTPFDVTGDGQPDPITNFLGIVSALDWVIDNRATFNIVALNMSLGSAIGGSSTTCWTPFDVALEQARLAGIAPVVSAGNDGDSNLIGSPGCSAFAISVGATDDTLVPTNFSNSGPGLELWAPGRNVSAGGIQMSGTSQAAPHVAGAFAVLAAANPQLTVDDILDQLQATGTSITQSGVTRPFIQLDAALGSAP
ncbi:MAG: S8 family serine peptidase, partial [Actinobacteria bacterium]|nr:S8 family serine peptidase [Actinomycetota bacterium]